MWLLLITTLIITPGFSRSLPLFEDVARLRRHISLRQASNVCSDSEQGQCRDGGSSQFIDICASGSWQSTPRGQWCCKDSALSLSCPGSNPSIPGAHLAPLVSTSVSSSASLDTSTSSTVSASLAASTSSHPDQKLSTQAPSSPGTCGPTAGRTGYSVCLHNGPSCKSDEYGQASYQASGKMASMYDAGPGAFFRCDIPPPSNGFYVALWTPYDSSLAAQPKPKNCGSSITLRNPKTGKSAVAQVIDRCQSCVGVEHQASDPTTPDYLVNGATVDLSRALWLYLYDGAPFGVYDIDYDGEVYLGTDSLPAKLSTPNCTMPGS